MNLTISTLKDLSGVHSNGTTDSSSTDHTEESLEELTCGQITCNFQAGHARGSTRIRKDIDASFLRNAIPGIKNIQRPAKSIPT